MILCNLHPANRYYDHAHFGQGCVYAKKNPNVLDNKL
jgi:hypothetical protein